MVYNIRGNGTEHGRYGNYSSFPPRPAGVAEAPPALGIMPMLAYARPHNSGAENAFIERFLMPFNPALDGFGNCIKRIGTAPVLWSCHTDTVAHKPGRQTVEYDEDHFAMLGKKGWTSTCLGGDDTVGVWLMTEMLRAGVSGLYIFHRAEERGCLGSKYLVEHNPGIVKGIDCAIALDRRNYHSVVTKMCHQRTCSDRFAESLAKQMGFTYRPDDGGLYTDTDKYTNIIGECTNLSVGYFDPHGSREQVDLRFLSAIREKLLHLDVDKLFMLRRPGERETYHYDSYSGTSHHQPTVTPPAPYKENNGAGFKLPHGREPTRALPTTAVRPPTKPDVIRPGVWGGGPRGFLSEDTDGRPEYERLKSYCEQFPEVCADILEQAGYNADDVWETIRAAYGTDAPHGQV